MTAALAKPNEDGKPQNLRKAATSRRARNSRTGVFLFSQGFRPFFLAAGLLAVTALPLWMLQFIGALSLPGVPDPLAWHSHEMLFGYLGAALAGFLLTAVPNWTGRLPIAGGPLMALFGLWVAGRIAMLIDAEGMVGTAVALIFLPVLAAVVWREVAAAGNRRNLPVCLLVTTLAVAQILYLLGPAEAGLRLGFATAAMMILLIGGRIIPSFTTNWLNKRGTAALPAPFGRGDKIVLALSLAALAVWVVWPEELPAAVLLSGAAAANLWRLARWRGAATMAEPLLLVLHLAYVWLPLGFALLALSVAMPALVLPQQALHALGAGGIGLMTLAVMTRASLGHSGRALTADRATTIAFGLVFLSAAARIAADWTADPMLLLHLAAAAWTGGFALFLLRFVPLLAKKREP